MTNTAGSPAPSALASGSIARHRADSCVVHKCYEAKSSAGFSFFFFKEWIVTMRPHQTEDCLSDFHTRLTTHTRIRNRYTHAANHSTPSKKCLMGMPTVEASKKMYKPKPVQTTAVFVHKIFRKSISMSNIHH